MIEPEDLRRWSPAPDTAGMPPLLPLSADHSRRRLLSLQAQEPIFRTGFKSLDFSRSNLIGSSAWTPSLVPNWADQTVYIVENDFGRSGRAYVETDSEYADLEATITGLLEGQYSNPVRTVAFNTAERWSEDVSEDVAHELRRRCDLQLRDLPSTIQDFVEQHEGHHRQLALRLV